ncbi:MAG: lamin tail domain-containing protein [Candidatus Pacebacteria bacterium]|nr:lamin tail domain-containing protein [Candidatus Paceibacterota bacterium]MCF7856922.1 lamin tail domain-containing protein [Candidatus Paceibacterota bacterium]
MQLIVINEVAWMGTGASANDEWIELYNSGSSAIDLEGWVLTDNVSLNIALTGILSTDEYAVLERTDDTTVEGVAFLIYSGALSNDGRTLTLQRSDNSIEDQVAGGENWENIGGNNETKETPQRTSSGWITGAPTPGKSNIFGTTESEDMSENFLSSGSNTSGGGSSSKNAAVSSVQKVKALTPEPFLVLKIKGPSLAYVNQEISLEAIPSGIGKTLMNSLVYIWNFGDTYTASSKKISHIFEYPGEYIVVTEAVYAKQKALVRHEITVLPVSFSLLKSEAGDVLLHNNSKYEVNISGFILKSDSQLTLPMHTVLKANGTLTISSKRLQLRPGGIISLYDATGTFVTSNTIKEQNGPTTEKSFSNPSPQNVLYDTEEVVTEPASAKNSSIEDQGVAIEKDVLLETMIPIGARTVDGVENETGFLGNKNMFYWIVSGIIILGIFSLYTWRSIKV